VVLAGAVLHGPARAAEPADGLRMDVRVEPGQVTVGEPFAVILQVEHSEGLEVHLPGPGEEWGSLTVLGSGERTEEALPNGGVRLQVSYRLAAFEVGTLEIPPLELLVGEGEEARTVSAPSSVVEVRSVLPAQEEGAEAPRIADLKAPATLPASLARLLALAGLGVLLLAAIGFWLWRRRRGGEGEETEMAPPVPAVPPDEEALEALRKLESGPLLARGRVKEYHVALAEIVKRYLFRRFAIATFERTTFEVLQDTRAASLEDWVPRRVAGLLEACDFVKFARQRPPVEQCRSQVAEARSLVLRTRPAPVSKELAESAGGEG
jgi:hypothetical protein